MSPSCSPITIDGLEGSSALAALSWGQRFDLVFCEVNTYLGAHAIGSPDRYGDLLAPPQVALLQDHVRDVMIDRVNHETLYRPDQSIFRMYGVTALDLDLTGRHAVAEHRFGMMAQRHA